MSLEKTRQLAAAVVLYAIAAPAMASDFRGFLTLFVAVPVLWSVVATAGFILLRRGLFARTGALRWLPLLLACAAGLPWLWLSIFPRMGGILAACLLLAGALAARNIWRAPYGATARWMAWLLLLLSAACAALVGWDLSNGVGRGESDFIIAAALLFLHFGVGVLLCVLVLRGRRPG